MMAKFRKKPVVIEAVKWNGFTIGLTNGGEPMSTERLDLPAWMPPVARVVTDEKWPSSVPAGNVWRDGDDLWIGTLEGPHRASPGDWIICGVKGELYPIKDEIFQETYEAV